MSEDMQKINEQLSALRKAHEEGNVALEKKLNAELDKQEKANQANIAVLNAKANRTDELEAKLISLEADLKRGNFSGEEKEIKNNEIKAFEKFLIEGKNDARVSVEAKYLRTDSNESGGYLAPAQYINEIIKNITEVSPVRQLARIIPTTAKEIQIPKRTGLISGGWVGEGGSSTISNSTYGMETLRAEKMMTHCDISIEMLRDSAFNIQQQVSLDVSEDFAAIEGLGFISGTGVGQPEGLLTNASVSAYAGGNASTLGADAMFGVQGELKAGYNSTWMFNRRTLHQHIRTLKDGSGQYLLQIGLGNLPNTVAGVPYVLANDMPDVATNTFPILIGDFRKAYYIVDNQNIEAIEDPYTQATTGKRRYIFFKRTGGQVVLPEAIKKIKIATSV